MDEEELPILTKTIAEDTDPNKTEDGLPILKKKDVSGSKSVTGNALSTPAKPSKTSTEKSTDTSKELNFVAAIKDMFSGHDKPADEKDKTPAPFINAVKRGLNLAEQADIIGPFADAPDAKGLDKVSKLQKETQNLPGSKEYTDFSASKTFGEAASNFAKNPVKILAELTGESLSSLGKYGAPRIASGALLGAGAGSVIPFVGTASGAAGGAVVGLADTSLGLEYSSSFLESLKDAGVDVTDPKSLTSAFQDDKIISEARSHALNKGIPIAIFDLISGGIAGKLVAKPAKSILGKIASGALELGTQSALGAGGELAGQVISGEEIQPGAIVAEAVGELGTSPVEIGAGALTFNKKDVINNVRGNVDTTNPASIDAAAEKIEKVIAPPLADEAKVDTGSVSDSDASVSLQDVIDERDGIQTNNKQEFQEPDQSGEKFVEDNSPAEGAKAEDTQTESAPQEEAKPEDILPEQSEPPISSPKQKINPVVGDEADFEFQGKKLSGIVEAVKKDRVVVKNSNITFPVKPENVFEKSYEQNTTQSPPKPQQDVLVEQTESKQQPPNNIETGAKDNGNTEPTKTYAIAQRIFDSDANEAIKRGVKEKGANYVPKKITVTESEAQNLIELYGDDRSESLIRDTKNDLSGDTRTALAAKLYEKYKNDADVTADPKKKSELYNKAVDIALISADQLKEAGRQTNAAKIWKAITSNEDMTVLAIEKENSRQSKKVLDPIQGKVTESRKQFDEEVRRIIAQKVIEGVEANLKRAKLITSEKRKQIADAFDKLKVNDVSGVANDITRVLGSAVWNGSIESVKRAVLAGADLANAVQAGIDYVRENYKGKFDEQEYKDAISPAVEQIIPKSKISPSDIDESKIVTPNLSESKKRNLISKVVDAYNSDNLTDDVFEDLYAEQLGVKQLTSEDRMKIRELAKVIAEVEEFETKVKDDFTPDNIAKHKELLAKAQRANDQLQEYAQRPSNVWDTLISIMQGNLLTPLSLVTNIYSNTVLQPLRFLSTSVGSVVDYSLSQLSKTGILNSTYRDRTIDLAELQKGYFQGGWNGVIEGGKQIVSGPKNDERNLREINTQFSPLRAIGRWADKNRTAEQKVNDYIEGTLGVPAEVMFRLLNAGDKPFRRAAETARAMELAKQKGLKGKEADKFIMFPDPASAEEIQKAGNDATFQQDNASAKFVQELLTKLINSIGKVPILGGPLKVIAKSQIPYVKTPWNIMVETLQYAAFPITGAVGIRQIARGDKRSGSVLIGKAIVGAMVFVVAKELFKLGLLSWDEPYDKKSGKQRERRQIQYDNIPPNALNVSAIQRGMIGDGFDIHDDDTWIDYTKLGVMGLLFDNYANNYFSNIKEKNQQPDESEFYVDMFTTAPRVLSQSLDQSFLKGTNTLLTALQDGGGYETEQWLINTSGALSSIVYPNTLSTISKSADEFNRDLRDENFTERLKNTYKTKFFIGEQLPAKVNLWGDKVTGQPEGRNKFAYYLFDPTKFKNVDTNNFKYKLYEAWKGDNFNDDWLPSIPKRDLTYRKVKIPLSGDMYEKMCTYVGQERARLVSTYINSSAFEMKDKDKVLKKLDDLYDKGRERGKKKFLMDTGWNILTPDKLSQIGKSN